ncbi:MAG: hypothetical protein EKK54_06060 [Neisseriaceae bacterium]|nr:MAG: hypothetical protein EKK54_06060 [Neisseriaceae bacterium]
MNKIMISLICSLSVYAQANSVNEVLDTAQNESVAIIDNKTQIVPPATTAVTGANEYKNLSQNDNTAAQLAKLNQDYQIAQAQQKINQLNNPSGKSDGLRAAGKTVVTGVMINEAGNRLATLKFPDGGTLDVELGSVVKNMRVTTITMNGVTMVPSAGCKGKKCKTVFYERVYDAPQYSGINTQVAKGINTPTMPFAGGNTMVPPIIGN